MNGFFHNTGIWLRTAVAAVLIFGTTSHSAGLWPNLKDSYDYYREVRRSGYNLLGFQQEREGGAYLCRDCPAHVDLAREVNEIARNIALTHPNENEDDLLPRIDDLERVLASASVEAPNGCPTETQYSLRLFNPDIDDDDLTLIFSSELSPENISSVRVDGATGTTHFFRGGSNNRDRIMRVDTRPDGTRLLRYYRLTGTSRARAGGQVSEHQPRTREVHQLLGGTSVSDGSDGSAEHSLSYGLIYVADEHKGRSIPRKAALVDFKFAEKKILSDKKLDGSVEVSTAHTRAAVTLRNEDNAQLLRIGLKPSGPELGLPIAARVLAVGPVELSKGEVILDTKGVEARVDLWGAGMDLGRVDVKSSYSGSSTEVSHTKRVGKNTSVTVRYASDDQDLGKSVFVFYTVTTDGKWPKWISRQPQQSGR